ncbi:MAG: hypothetical protein ACXADX_20595 [Candidatus Hodarchaeales archaeon]|jgi:hypothetical protein
MLYWIVPTLVLASLILILTEVWVRRFSLKSKEPHVYEQMGKTISRIADEAHEDEELPATTKRPKEYSRTGQSDKRTPRIE